MPKVLNAHKLPNWRSNLYKDVVYVGRPSKWGNPYRIGRDGTREEVIQKFSEALTGPGSRETLGYDVEDCKRELKGKDLVCWCAPEACHADVLLEIANEEKI